ncbi:GNAT family protein [Erwinia sp. P7711]|uniref:GNAT family N-acetyltransferase n=1 Tax=Erwinia sp. P7711 TaxID=3141451 RepID=UPI003189182A
MTQRVNKYQQPIGEAIEEWSVRPRPERVVLSGRFCRLEPLESEKHFNDLYEAYGKAPDGRDWTYMFTGPFEDENQFRGHLNAAATSSDAVHFAVIDLKNSRAVGTLALMRIEPVHGVMEVGHVTFSPALKRTPLSTEAHFLLMTYAFDRLGYRRYEWKCDSLNAPSRKAAERLGFTFEGIFRQALIYKGRTRDTAWFSIIDSEWQTLRTGFERWLSAGNFDADGQQIQRLSTLRKAS